MHFSQQVHDDGIDESDIDVADKISKGILHYISPYYWVDETKNNNLKSYSIDDSRLEITQGSWAGCSQFRAFSKRYKSKFDEFIKRYSRVGIYPKEDVLPPHMATLQPPDQDNIPERYQNFKRFDIITDLSDHLFSTKPMDMYVKLSLMGLDWWFARMDEEWKSLEENLPETIFVRVSESRKDLLRAVIIGPKGTPYQDGLFFFDVYFPPFYPDAHPLVRYHSGGFGINPYLLACGEVLLHVVKDDFKSLSQMLRESTSVTMLQLLLRIQDRLLNVADPLFLQPGFSEFVPSVAAEYFSLLYNEDIVIKSLKIMINIMNKPPKNFEAFVVGHFRNRAFDILSTYEAYTRGQQVGGNKESCCSSGFQSEVKLCFPCLVDCFIKIGATEAYKFRTQSAPTKRKPEENAQSYIGGKKVPKHD